MNDRASGEDLRAAKFYGPDAGRAEEWFASPFNNRRCTDSVFVEKPSCSEGIGESAGSPDDDVLTIGLLHLGDFIEQICTGDNGRRVPSGDVDRLGRNNVFVDRVDVIRERVAAHRGPSLSHALVRDPTEEKGVSGKVHVEQVVL